MKIIAISVMFLLCLGHVIATNEDFCNQPMEVGICRALLKRYYYDSAVKRCKVFYYGGCEGNGNNFLTRKECRLKCMPDATPDKPRKPKDKRKNKKNKKQTTPLPPVISLD
uniref:Kunitz inhibitor 1 n=1 Tax=Simulium bannaense TaxID=1619335 RepID=A0A7S5T5L0_9DIPT|nr:kunitz inhibitor 1 precursor [Simulium bannaense]